jgi:NAD(P)-dependent dehydrogenase (short-subunit alcohol dehydrogenase family)
MNGNQNEVNFKMHGRVALLTGAGRGIGLAMAQALAAAGCAVAIQDIDLSVAEEEARKINAAGGRAIALGGDILNLDLPARAVNETVEKLGGLHVLVNNAAIQEHNHWQQVTATEIERQLRADIVSPLLFCQQVTPIFTQQKFGRILNIGSIQQRRGSSELLPYAMSKAALICMNTALARELASHYVTVNLIAPGWINTYRNRHDFSGPQDMADKGRRIPLGRIGEPEDFGGIALLLCSDAGSYITGQTIYVDGGMSVR